MMGEVAATLASNKNLGEIVSRLKDASERRKTSAAFDELQTKFIGLRSLIMESQQSEAAAMERTRAAEQKCVELEDFSREAKRYVMHEIAPGFVAYTLKPGMENGAPPHYLCANCFAKNQKGFMQRDDVPHMIRYKCHNCGSDHCFDVLAQIFRQKRI